IGPDRVRGEEQDGVLGQRRPRGRNSRTAGPDEATRPAVSRRATRAELIGCMPTAHHRGTVRISRWPPAAVAYPSRNASRLHAALWIGALLVAAGTAVDALPVELDELAAQFFLRSRRGRPGVAGRCTCAQVPRDVELVTAPLPTSTTSV